MNNIGLSFSKGRSVACSLDFNLLHIEIKKDDGILHPDDIKKITLPQGDKDLGVVLFGRVPIWVYAHLVTRCQSFPWIASFDPRQGAVVVSTNSNTVSVGMVIPIYDTEQNQLTIIVGGNPHSGKTVFLNLLYEALRLDVTAIFKDSLAPDGEGVWTQMVPEELTKKIRVKKNYTPELIPQKIEHLKKMKLSQQIILLDYGGKIDESEREILDLCTHYILVYTDEATDISKNEWRDFFNKSGMQPLIEVRSELESDDLVINKEPILKLTLGNLERGKKDCLSREIRTQLVDYINENLKQ